MKNLVFFLLLIFIRLPGQNGFQGVVVAKNKEPVPFCAISMKHQVIGTITNEQGIFRINLPPQADTLVFYCIGYKKKEVALALLLKVSQVQLEPEGIDLSEITVTAYDERPYAILSQCREKLLKSKEQQSKVYFSLESYLGGQPVELLECFYNARFNDRAVVDLEFKNGRSGLAPTGNRYFINLNTSKVFTTFHLTEKNERLPLSPLQLNAKQLKKTYHTGFISGTAQNDSIYEIYFAPKAASEPAFTGRVWINKKTFSLQKITLDILTTRKHPFLPLHDFEKVNSVSMHFSKSFSAPGIPLHIDFRYKISYTTRKNPLVQNSADSTFNVTCKGLLFFFDHTQQYIPPYFTYDAASSDYRKISLLTYNEAFWQHQPAPVLSDSIRKSLLYIRKNGTLINFSEHSMTNALTVDKIVEFNYPKWSAKKRLTVKNSGMKHDTSLTNPAYHESFLTDRYHIKAQIFMDLNVINDSIQYQTVTIFDAQESFYNIPMEEYTNVYLNIYFDLYEIGRRKMETKIKAKKYSVGQLDSLYKATITDLEEEAAEYRKYVTRGKNKKELEKYNTFVYEHLGIDNLKIFQMKN